MLKKRGQSLMEILPWLIAAVIVLVVLIFGFSTNWQIFSSLLGTDNNVNIITTQCQTACTQGSTYGFCNQNRTLKATDLPGGVKEVTSNCKDLATRYPSYGIQLCPSLCS
jgi:hypothetical protein